jgi:hypothetical protein
MGDDAYRKYKICLSGKLSPGCHLQFEVGTTNPSTKSFTTLKEEF